MPLGRPYTLGELMTCPECNRLAREYEQLIQEHGDLIALDANNRHLRDDSNAISGGGDSIAMKERAEASREACHAARRRYADHLHEHGCDGRRAKSAGQF
jgi:hypothetical protein